MYHYVRFCTIMYYYIISHCTPLYPDDIPDVPILPDVLNAP